MNPGIYRNIGWDDYQRIPGVSITRLKEMRRSPMHYRHRLANPLEGAALTLGSAIHCAVLEPHLFEALHAVWDEQTDSGSQRPRRGKAWDAFCLENAGKRILTAAEMTACVDTAQAVRADPDAARYLKAGHGEVTMVWRDGPHVCHGRLDWLTEVDGETVLVGLKTARDCRPFMFGAAAAKLGYHMQWAFYEDGWRALSDRPARTVEIVVEAVPPHAVAVYRIPEDVTELGRAEYRVLLDQLAECQERGAWPGPVQGEQELSLPAWAYPREDDVDDIGLDLSGLESEAM